MEYITSKSENVHHFFEALIHHHTLHPEPQMTKIEFSEITKFW